MSFTSLDFTSMGSQAYIVYNTDTGFKFLSEVLDGPVSYLSDGASVSLGSCYMQGAILTALTSNFSTLSSRNRAIVKVGSSWAVVTEFLDNSNVVLDRTFDKGRVCTISSGTVTTQNNFTAGTKIVFESTGVLPTGIAANTIYYVLSPTLTNFTFSTTLGGSPVSTTGGSGLHSVYKVFDVITPSYYPDIIKDTIVAKVVKTGTDPNFVYTIEPYYSVNNESNTVITTVSALPGSGEYEGQLVLYDNLIYTWDGSDWVTSSGEGARTVSLSVTQQAFDYTSNGNKVGTPTSTVTATAFGTTGTLTYVFKVDGVTVTGVDNTYSYTPKASFGDMPDIITVDLYEDSVLVASDLITMFGVIEGGDAITIILSNEAHTVPTDSSGGSPDFTGSGTTIKVFRGSAALNYVSGGTTSSFDVSFTDEGVEGGSITGSGTNTASIGPITSISAATGYREFTITVYFDGTTSTFSKVQSFSRSLAGTNGTNGLNNAVVYLYQRTTSTPSAPTGVMTYTFSTKVLSGTPGNGWTTTIPAGSNPLYVIAATASSNTSTDTIATNEWSSPVILSQDGAQGVAGLNSATVYLYQRAASAPSVPSVNVTYTFSTGVATGQNNGWTQTLPTSGTDPIWVITATAASNTATDTIATGEWAAPAILAQNGTNGTNGVRGAGRWHIPVTSLPTDNTTAQAAWNTAWTGKPGVQVASDQAWFYTGTQANPTGQAVFIYSGTAWNLQDEVIDGNLLVTDTITADKLNVTQLSAIAADLGTVTAGTIRGGTVLPVTSLTTGVTYIIESLGNTNFTLIGAASNTVGLAFVKNSTAGTGTGTALTAERTVITSSVIEVFDSANVRRVRLGVWT